MATVIIEEVKHTLAAIKVKTGASKETLNLLHKFLETLDLKLQGKGYKVFFRTHQIGVTGFCNPKKAFVYINLNDSYFSIKFWTGDKGILGLAKANWVNKGDNKGSEWFKVEDSDVLAP